ncbi:MAG: hypothetical protein SOR23_05700 [Candidatus Enterosoma sp.]|nr:hypothetical protein [Candidatus Enterosoma sp.]
MKQKLLPKKIFLIQIALSAVSFLLPLFPTLYSEDNRFIQPISGYSSFVFLNDKESTFLYYGTLMLSLYLAFMAILFIFGIVSLFMPKERERGDKRVSLLFLSFSLIASIVLVVFYSLIQDLNLHLNIGSVLILIFSVIFFVTYLIFFILEKKKRGCYEINSSETASTRGKKK